MAVKEEAATATVGTIIGKEEVTPIMVETTADKEEELAGKAETLV